jgi:WD40 repeat protein
MAFPASLKKVNGFVKIYDVNTAEPKKTIGVELGAYGLCRVSTYLLIGSYDNTIKYVNLDDEEHQVETSRQLSEEPGTSFFELKVSKFSKDKHEILALNTDGKVRRFEVSFDLIT